MTLEQLVKGQKLQINKSYHVGRTYVVIGFNADKFGCRYALCEWLEEKGAKSSHYIFAGDLN